MDEKTELVIASQPLVTARDFMPVFDIAAAIERRNAVVEFVKKIMIEGIDYGSVPGVDKPTLLQPGAEKLISFFGLTPLMELVDRVEDWSGKEHGGEAFFFYRYRCTMKRGDRILGVEEASANSWEVKYRYRWVPLHEVPNGLDPERLPSRDAGVSEFEFAIEKAETSGLYGKPAAHWERFREAIKAGTARRTTRKTRAGKELPALEIGSTVYRMPNPEVADQVNTIMQMAEKRAKIRATRSCTSASEFFTQDVEDMGYIEPVIVSKTESKTSAPEDENQDAPRVRQPQAKAKKDAAKDEEKGPLSEGQQRILRARMESGKITDAQLERQFKAPLSAIPAARFNDVAVWLREMQEASA